MSDGIETHRLDADVKTQLSRRFFKAGALAAAALGLMAAVPALAGQSNEYFHIEYDGGIVDVDHQTKAITGTPGYMKLTHFYPVDSREAHFRMGASTHNSQWTPGLNAGNTAYLYNSYAQGRNVHLEADVVGIGGGGHTMKGYWRSN